MLVVREKKDYIFVVYFYSVFYWKHLKNAITALMQYKIYLLLHE